MKEKIKKIVNLKKDTEVIKFFLKDLKNRFPDFRNRFPFFCKFFTVILLILKWFLIVGIIIIIISFLYFSFIKDVLFAYKIKNVEKLESELNNCEFNTTISFYPSSSLIPYEEYGVCSFYGPSWGIYKLSSGEYSIEIIKKYPTKIGEYTNYLSNAINICNARSKKILTENKENLELKQQISNDLINKINLQLPRLKGIEGKVSRFVIDENSLQLIEKEKIEFLLGNKGKLIDHCTIEELQELINECKE